MFVVALAVPRRWVGNAITLGADLLVVTASPSKKSMAQRRMALIAPDRESQVEHIRARLVELGDDEGLNRVDAASAGWATTEWAASNPMTAVVSTLTEQVLAAMRDLGAPQERLATVCVTGTLQEEVSAQLVPFADGSGLVQVSDAIMSLCGVYAQFLGLGMAPIANGSRLRGMWRALKAARSGSLAHDPALLTGLLRYYNIHQRVYGLAGKVELRVPPAVEPLGHVVSLQAWQFVIGHEIAHHVLGHDSVPSALSPDELLPPCSSDHQRELDADRLAYAAIVRAQKLELGDLPSFAVLGALTAMYAIHVTEDALFVRRGCTHPPAEVRAARLLEQVTDEERNFAAVFASGLQIGTDASAAFRAGVPAYDWKGFFAHPMVESSHGADYLGTIPVLDLGQCQPRDHVVRAFAKIDETEGTNLSPGAARAASGDAGGALIEWGVRPTVVTTLLDRSRPLTFHTVLDAVRTACRADDTVPAKAVLAVAIGAATLLEPLLAGGDE